MLLEIVLVLTAFATSAASSNDPCAGALSLGNEPGAYKEVPGFRAGVYADVHASTKRFLSPDNLWMTLASLERSSSTYYFDRQSAFVRARTPVVLINLKTGEATPLPVPDFRQIGDMQNAQVVYFENHITVHLSGTDAEAEYTFNYQGQEVVSPSVRRRPWTKSPDDSIYLRADEGRVFFVDQDRRRMAVVNTQNGEMLGSLPYIRGATWHPLARDQYFIVEKYKVSFYNIKTGRIQVLTTDQVAPAGVVERLRGLLPNSEPQNFSADGVVSSIDWNTAFVNQDRPRGASRRVVISADLAGTALDAFVSLPFAYDRHPVLPIGGTGLLLVPEPNGLKIVGSSGHLIKSVPLSFYKILSVENQQIVVLEPGPYGGSKDKLLVFDSKGKEIYSQSLNSRFPDGSDDDAGLVINLGGNRLLIQRFEGHKILNLTTGEVSKYATTVIGYSSKYRRLITTTSTFSDLKFAWKAPVNLKMTDFEGREILDLSNAQLSPYSLKHFQFLSANSMLITSREQLTDDPRPDVGYELFYSEWPGRD